MKRKFLSTLLVFALLLLPFSMIAGAVTEEAPADYYIPGAIIVVFETEPEIIEDGDYFIVEGITCSSIEPLCPSEDPDVTYLLVLPEGANSQEETETAIAILKANPNVSYVEQDSEIFFDDPVSDDSEAEDFYIPGEIIVIFYTEPEVIEDGDFFIVAGVTCASVEPVSAFEDPCLTYLLVLPEGANSQEETETAIAILKANPNVDIAEQNFWMDFDDPVTTPGDINDDGEINLTDYTMAKRIVMGTYAVDYGINDPTDVNKDDVVDMNDYILIKRHVMQTYVIG
ncbi:MAG: dockerin type I repeat-containing protein [Clostridia bacterium]|nr:dockerin type I repeat-containing protein [Clostridia bacterium]